MKSEPSLLEKAKSIKTARYDKTDMSEFAEVAIAWVNNEIGITQISKAIGKEVNGGAIYAKIATALKHHINSKKIKL